VIKAKMQLRSSGNLSEFLTYLANIPDSSDQRIPPLAELSKILGISVATLREQLVVARLLGIVEVKPKSGIHKKPFDISSLLKNSLTYAASANYDAFHLFSDLRKHLEGAYFIEAAQLLGKSELSELEALINSARTKIDSIPGQNPTTEHREFHLIIYKNLKNDYLNGILDAYWEAYHQAGLEIYPDHKYIDRIWQYHAAILENIKLQKYNQALVILSEHMELINQREKVIPRLSFE
jgi:DNA-binding FadR family transcriptional regulator